MSSTITATRSIVTTARMDEHKEERRIKGTYSNHIIRVQAQRASILAHLNRAQAEDAATDDGEARP